MPSKKYLVVWSESAAFDLKSIVSFIAVDSMQNARETFAKIKKESQLLEAGPRRCPLESPDAIKKNDPGTSPGRHHKSYALDPSTSLRMTQSSQIPARRPE